MNSGVEVLALRSPTLPPATTTNCYFLGDQDFAIVDPASPWLEEQERLLGHLEALKSRGRRPACILLTHHHYDHVAGVTALREATALPVVAHPRTAELLAERIPVDRTLEEGDFLQTGSHRWSCLHTPGHATGHLCFFNEETGALVLGDMVAGEGTIVLDPPEGDLEAYLASLERLKTLNARVLFPAHGPALTQPELLLDHYISHRKKRTEQIQQAAAARSHFGPADLVPEIYADLPRTVWPIAERQVLCHLQYLERQGEMESEGDVFRHKSA
jgi:glyoxylase-like metal-dependent hydrolase (beta-lactamase superfamily II)